MDKHVGWKLVAIVILNLSVQLSNATILVISKATNETVFSAEEIGIDAASAYDLKGGLIIADPPHACGDVKPPPPKNETIVIGTFSGPQVQHAHGTWVLWATYNYSNDLCSLSRKAKEAEYAGYAAIVITIYGTNDTSGILPSFMGFDWMGVRIYTSILGENMGNALKKYAYPKKYYIEFENEPYFQLGLLANFIFLGCIGIVIVVVLLRLFHCIYMRVSRTVSERRRKRKAFLTESQLKKLPVLHWRTSIPQDTCSICIENFEVGEEIRVLPCSHVFHKPCIDPWLIHSSRRCPNCKGKVIFPNEHLSDSSNSDSDSPLEDSDDDFLGNERTPLLRSNAADSDDQMEDTRFVEAIAESHNTRARTPSPTTLRMDIDMDEPMLSTDRVETACLIDISTDTAQLPDTTIGSFPSSHSSTPKSSKAKGTVGESLLLDIDSSEGSVKSFGSDKTFVGNDKEGKGHHPLRNNDTELTSSFSSNASFFSCVESELEKSSSSNGTKHEMFHSFSASS